jgi:lipoprotein-anchoring transpeptidase ErfK/SrfK
MRKVLPDLPAGMEGGLESPLGARAMYLYQDGRDTLFRIHGTNEPWSIGEKVSSGCVRLLNEDVADLYERVKVGAKVYVRNSKHGTGMKDAPEDVSG